MSINLTVFISTKPVTQHSKSVMSICFVFGGVHHTVTTRLLFSLGQDVCSRSRRACESKPASPQRRSNPLNITPSPLQLQLVGSSSGIWPHRLLSRRMMMMQEWNFLIRFLLTDLFLLISSCSTHLLCLLSFISCSGSSHAPSLSQMSSFELSWTQVL